MFPIFLFYDDFDTGNVLGSHSGSKNLGGVYVSLPSLPPHLRAKLICIFLTITVYSEDRKSPNNNNKFFNRIIRELNDLSDNGMAIQINGETKHIYFQCVSLLGDNLGMNQVCGFEGGFIATYHCRRCRVRAETAKSLNYECLENLRTVENYEEDLKNLEHSVKSPCVFNRIHNFYIIITSLLITSYALHF